MVRFRILLGVLLLPLLIAACENTATCTPTTTEAEAADKVDLTAVGRSSTLGATLTVSGTGQALSGKTLKFSVFDDDAQVYRDEGSTGSDGSTRIDLKKIEPGALQGLARGDEFRAAFEGDSTYCSSSDDAEFRVLKAPAGITVRGL